jgi:hypothetical protein
MRILLVITCNADSQRVHGSASLFRARCCAGHTVAVADVRADATMTSPLPYEAFRRLAGRQMRSIRECSFQCVPADVRRALSHR